MLDLFSLPPMARTLLIYAGWFTLPNWATSITVVFYNRALAYFISNYKPPVRGSPQAAMQWRYCYAFVMIFYLVATTIQSFLSMPLNFYEVLGVGPNVDNQALKVAFRNFARRNHPDRVGPQGASLFIAVRDAYEALNDPMKRFAYDRFGPDAMTWTDCITTREYVTRGLLSSSGFYIGTIAFLGTWSVFGVQNSGSYWRNLLFCTLFVLEFYLMINSPSRESSVEQSSIPFLALFRKRIPYQYTLFLHQLYLSLSIALSRVLPVLLPVSRESALATDRAMNAVKPVIDKLALLAFTADREVSRLLSTELRSMHGASALPSSLDSSSSAQSSFIPSDSTIAVLTSEMENLLIDKQIQSHPVLRGHWETAIARRRQEVSRPSQDAKPKQAKPLTPPQSLSPVEPPKEFSSLGLDHLHFVAPTNQSIPGRKELLSPRPSPYRELGVYQSSENPGYVRGRSRSC